MASIGQTQGSRPERLNFKHSQFRADGLETSPAVCLGRFGQRHAIALRFIWNVDGKTNKTKLEQRSRNRPGMLNLAGSVVQSARARGLCPADL